MSQYRIRHSLLTAALLAQAACAEDGKGAPGEGDLEDSAVAASHGDAGEAGTGVWPDAGGVDAGGVDAGASDASMMASADAGGLDAQVVADAGTALPDAAPKVYEDLGDGTVRDAATGLTWQRAVAPQRLGWEAAKTYCAQLGLAGAGWRLPTMEELRSIVDPTREPSIDEKVFPGTPAKDFWSASSGLDSPGWADGVSFSDGTWFSRVPTDEVYVRCVR